MTGFGKQVARVRDNSTSVDEAGDGGVSNLKRGNALFMRTANPLIKTRKTLERPETWPESAPERPDTVLERPESASERPYTVLEHPESMPERPYTVLEHHENARPNTVLEHLKNARPEPAKKKTGSTVIEVSTRVQLLWMDFSIASSYFNRHVLPLLRKHARAGSRQEPRLVSLRIERENLHSRICVYRVAFDEVSSPSAKRKLETRVCAFDHTRVLTVSSRHVSNAEDSEMRDAKPEVVNYDHITPREKLSTLTAALANSQPVSVPVIDPTTCFDFWESIEWWRARVPVYWFEHPYRRNSRRVAHLLNQLVRLLRQVYRLDTATAVFVLNRLSRQQIDLIDSVFVEPINGSLLPSHLCSIFMHNKQQTGLNMKHEANKQIVLSSKYLQSEREFDPKIYLKKCTSCVKRDIFEVMVRFQLRYHNREVSRPESATSSVSPTPVPGSITQPLTVPGSITQPLTAQSSAVPGSVTQPTPDSPTTGLENSTPPPPPLSRNEFIFCECPSCRRLRRLANAWRYYDCEDHVWVRFEFSRKVYQSICEILETETKRGAAQLVYTSDKNEFTDKHLFVSNFVNYYSFYENNQHPLVIDQCSGKMRNTVTILYTFAVINWVMIENARSRSRNNSISLNQQSLCKSLNNPLFSIFSENCINRLRAETVRRCTPENAAYINRGLGIVPNTGINAFNLSCTCWRRVQ